MTLKKKLEELYNLYTSFIDGIEPALIDDDQEILKEIGKTFEALIKESKNREEWAKIIAELQKDYKLRIMACEDNKFCAEKTLDLVGKHFYRGYLDAYEEVNKDLEELISKA